jgi:hypothetical protein
VRAVFENGGTGKFSVYRNGSAVIVHHGSLGGPGGTFSFAVVVNLGFEPTEAKRDGAWTVVAAQNTDVR